MPQHPHDPACHDQSAHEHGEAVQAIAELTARCLALGDAENGRSENREQQSGVEVGECEDQVFFRSQKLEAGMQKYQCIFSLFSDFSFSFL